MSLGVKRGRLPLGVLSFALMILCLLLVAAAFLVMRDDDEEAASVDTGNRIVYGLTLNPSGFDPHRHISSELGIPFFSVYDMLVYRHPQNMDFAPGLADRWEMAPDGLSWTFYLKQNVTFHDGTPFNAQAVGTNIDRILNPEVGSQKARSLLGPFTGYEVIDSTTIKLNFSEPFAPLLDGLSQVYLGIASPKALSEYSNNTYQFHQVGTGPYKLVEMVPGDHITLQANEDYAWGPVFYAPRVDQSIDTIEFRFYEDPTTRSLALESGEIHMIGELLPTDAELLIGNTELQIYPVPIMGTPQQFFMNTTRAPLDNLAVRQALLYATNRTAIVDAVFQGRSPVAYGPITSTMPFYNAEVKKLYPHDTNYARSLLEGAGYTDSDQDGIFDLNNEPLKLTMILGPWNQMPDVAQLIQSQWREFGIELDLIQVPDYPALLEYANEGNYDLIAIYDFGVDASVINQFYLSDGARNWSGFSDPEVDQWLHEAVRQMDPATRTQLYGQAQQRIMDQAVVLPIREYINLNGATATLDGVIFNAQGWWPLLRNFQLNP